MLAGVPADDELLAAWFLSDDPRAVLDASAAIAARSCGRVRKPETVNARTGKPERDGLHCARIFGPVEDHRCLCGKLHEPAQAGQVCDKCGVLCGDSRLRDVRWGHIESPTPLLHPTLAPRIAAALGCDVRGLARVVAFEADLRDDGRVVPPEEMGRGQGPARVVARLGDAGAALMPTCVPVVPPTWRATRRDPVDGGYMALLGRCNRLSRLIELDAPVIILDNEARMTQQALDRLIAAARAELRVRGPVTRAPATDRAAALLQAVYDEPQRDAPRRAYAEFLTEHGDPRGEFITRQLASAACTRTPRGERDMLRRNFDAWIAPLGEAVEPGVTFRRGFPAACRTLTAGARARLGDPAWATIEHLETEVAELIVDPALRGLESLSAPLRALRAVCEAGVVLPQIHSLQVRMQRLGPEALAGLTRADALPGVVRLTLAEGSSRAPPIPAWLGGTPLARGLERLRVELPLEALETLDLGEWVRLLDHHPRLGRVHLSFARRLVSCELRRDDGFPALRLITTRALLERVALGLGELAVTLGRALTGVEPHTLPLLEVESPGPWYGDELAALAQQLRAHFGPSAKLPLTWT